MDVDRGMGEKKQFNALAFGIVYFLMFAVAFAMNKDGKMILYPEVGPGFFYTLLMDTLIGIGVGLVVVLLSQWLTVKSKAMQDLSAELYAIVGEMHLQDVFFLACFFSIGEEFLFRGIVQGHFGLLLASILFGVLHSAPGQKGRIWSLFAMIMGLVLGAEYLWRKNIFTPIWTHFIVNFFNVYLLQNKMKKTTPGS
ncbi:MAG: CPBP family intramembrane metalloprotease [Deltaproteobacteria bacterium]|nr:CPBP family intramembrane metalloprotease [Deltaproteobacteria bacterium]